MDQADHAAVRCRQPVRHHLRDQGWLRHRRVRAAIRATPRILFRHLAETVTTWNEIAAPGFNSGGGLGQSRYRAKLQSGRIAPDTSVNAPSTNSATSSRL